MLYDITTSTKNHKLSLQCFLKQSSSTVIFITLSQGRRQWNDVELVENPLTTKRCVFKQKQLVSLLELLFCIGDSVDPKRYTSLAHQELQNLQYIWNRIESLQMKIEQLTFVLPSAWTIHAWPNGNNLQTYDYYFVPSVTPFRFRIIIPSKDSFG
jgi:hypothetical protein